MRFFLKQILLVLYTRSILVNYILHTIIKRDTHHEAGLYTFHFCFGKNATGMDPAVGFRRHVDFHP